MTRLEEAQINKSWAETYLLDPGHLPQGLTVQLLEDVLIEAVQVIADHEAFTEEEIIL